MTFRIELDSTLRPRYVAVADAIARAMARHELLPGMRLPTHRALADELGLALATVSKGYAEAERQGLIESFVGRGTFAAAAVDQSLPPSSTGLVDLAVHQIPIPQHLDLQALLQRLASWPHVEDLLAMQPSVGAQRHRQGGAAWLRSCGLDTSPEQIIICNGGQHAMLAIMASIHDRGGAVVTEHLTDPSLKAVAALLGRRLTGVPMDAQGMDIDALDALCRKQPVALVVCTPNLHNPTNATMPQARREALAALARKHDFTILESDIYGVMCKERLPPVARFAPERTLFVASLAKAIGPGLKVGYIHAPLELVEQVAAGLRLSTWMAAPLGAEVAHQLISVPRQLERILQAQREEAARRVAVVSSTLAEFRVRIDPQSWHVWLQLPPDWRSDEFHHHTEALGIRIAPLGAFAVGRNIPAHAARLCIGAVGPAELQVACEQLARLMSKPPYLSFPLV
ncbi:MAG TPA: PLP-dependent aminotransferase family protein [Burkholderiaceae bacterium]|nr:PLP-dependent aminotransferase family protein [Burkholderiaceae bacterium]